MTFSFPFLSLSSLLSRAFIQFIVVFKYQTCVLTSPAVPNVDRKKAHPLPHNLTPPPDDQPVAYTGSRTGKVIRSVHAGKYTVEPLLKDISHIEDT